MAAPAASLPAFEIPYPDQNRGPSLVRTCWVLLSLSTVVVLGRIYSKLRKTRRLYWDDALMIFALACGFVHAALITRAVDTGLGRHLLFLTVAQREATLRIGSFTLAFAFLSPMAGRIGFCVTLLYLAGTDARVKKWPIWLFIALQVLVNLSVIIVFYTQCGAELDIFWNPAKQALIYTRCENPRIQTDYGYFQGSFNTLTDAFLTALPAVLIEHTRLSTRTKIGLALLLCLSVLAMVASIVKTYEAKSLSEILDYTWDLCPYVIWLSIELNVVMIVSSIPLLRPIFQTSSRKQLEQHQLQPRHKTSHMPFSPFASTKNLRAHVARMDSQEFIMKPADTEASQGSVEEEDEVGITVTREVLVTYETSQVPYVHAALVGLVQGEIANPWLVKS